MRGQRPQHAIGRILHADPVLFSKSLVLQWQPHDESVALDEAGIPIACNDMSSGGGWPPHPSFAPAPKPEGDRTQGVVQVTAFSWVYTC